MRRFFIIPILFSILAFAFPAYASEPDPWEDYDEAAFMDMDFGQNLASPAVPRAQHQAIKNYMADVAMYFARKNYVVEMDRDDEVVVIVLPSDQLFLPNDTLLWARGLPKFKPILDELKPDAGMYKLLVTVHTDNTGSPAYNNELSHQRVNSLYDWLLGEVSEDQVVIPFFLGDSDPVESNATRVGRAANRRVELYLIPGPEMIVRAARGRLR